MAVIYRLDRRAAGDADARLLCLRTLREPVPGRSSGRDRAGARAPRIAGAPPISAPAAATWPALRKADPELMDEDSAVLGAGRCAASSSGSPTKGRALAVGHSPTNETAVLGLSGSIIEPMAEGGLACSWSPRATRHTPSRWPEAHALGITAARRAPARSALVGAHQFGGREHVAIERPPAARSAPRGIRHRARRRGRAAGRNSGVRRARAAGHGDRSSARPQSRCSPRRAPTRPPPARPPAGRCSSRASA